MVKALARAHRWKRMLEEGRCASIGEMAAAEWIDRGYPGRILEPTLLAPVIVEKILDGPEPEDLTLPKLMEPFPAEWPLQRAVVQSPCSSSPSPMQRPDAAAGTRPPSAQSTDAPERRSSSATLGSSAVKKAANASGVLPAGS
jgi:hypothetical protein